MPKMMDNPRMASRPTRSAPSIPSGLVRTAVHAIGLDIVSGRISAEGVLPQEQALADRYQVSRTGLREAIKVLSGKGLVRTARRYGSRVCRREEWNFLDPDVLGWHLSDPANLPEFLRDIGEMRLMLEPAATALAARRATADEITRILELASELGLVPTVDTVEIDIAFHIAVLRASHNMFIAGLCPAMAVLLRAYFWAMWKLHPGGPKNPAREDLHLRMGRAISAGNVDDAVASITEMLQITRQDIERVLTLLAQRHPAAALDRPSASHEFTNLVAELSGMFVQADRR